MNHLITGGAGFIGSHLADALIARGDNVRLFDNLEEQVHGGCLPAYLSPRAEFIKGDVRDPEALAQALKGIEVVIHCASAVGVAQSQYEIKRYCDVNVGGTANLLDIIINEKLPIKKILLPTSMTSYGEGCYRCSSHGTVRPGLRTEEQLSLHDWQLHCPECGTIVDPIPTPEDAERQSGTIYALSKNMQEDMVMNIARTYKVPAVALRLFNVYGPRQSLSNPYTGVTAIFMSRLKNGQPPVLYEDGEQSRDFISVHDVVSAFIAAMDSDRADGQVLNIGSGQMTPIKDIALSLAELTGKDITPSIPGNFRKNDVRHCFADRSRAEKLLRWKPTVSLSTGLQELVTWAEDQTAEDKFAQAEKILRNKGLT